MAIENFTIEELKDEAWLPVVGYEGYYSVSNVGRVRRENTRTNALAGRILRPDTTSAGYKTIQLSRHGTRRRFKVYRLVAFAFIGPCPSGLQVNHIDCNPFNNRLGNLEYVTGKQNMQHAIAMGRRASGSDVNTSKLTETQVLRIRQLLSEGMGGPTLAKMFGVRHPTIYKIGKREIWKHI